LGRNWYGPLARTMHIRNLGENAHLADYDLPSSF
jgi:hypothetical protein